MVASKNIETVSRYRKIEKVESVVMFLLGEI